VARQDVAREADLAWYGDECEARRVEFWQARFWRGAERLRKVRPGRHGSHAHGEAWCGKAGQARLF
jgi:hypothetical protein